MYHLLKNSLALLSIAFAGAQMGDVRADTIINTSVPGATVGERNLRVAWRLLPDAIKDCVDHAQTCGLTAHELVVLQGELQSYAQEDAAQVLQLKSGVANPGLFDLSQWACGRVAVTQLHVGAPIFFNSDLLDEPGTTLGSWVSLLVHELGHHQGELDTATRPLDALGNKVMTAFQANWSELVPNGSPGTSRFKFGFYKAPGGNIGGWTTHVVIWDDQTTYAMELSNAEYALGMQQNCGKTDPTQRLTYLENLRWIGNETAVPGDKSVLMDVGIDCADGQAPQKRFLLISFTLKKIGDSGLALDLLSWTASFEADADLNYETQLKTLSLSTNTHEIRNGGDWIITARLKRVRMLDISIQGCGANIASDQIKTRLESGRPIVIIFDSCELTPLGDDTYDLRLKKTFPKNTPERDYHIEVLMLMHDRESGLVALPLFQKDATVHVSSDNPPPPLTALDASLRTSVGETPYDGYKKYYGYHDGEKFDLDVTFDHPAEIQEGYLWGEVYTDTQPIHRIAVTGPLGQFDQFSLGLKQGPNASGGWLADYLFQLPTSLGEGFGVKGFKWDRMVFIMSDLREVVYELPANELAAFSWEKTHP